MIQKAQHLLRVFLFILLLPFHVFSQDDRTKGWSADIDTLLVLMKREHYIYRSKPLPEKLLTDAAALKKKISQFSDERMLLELERLMFYMHDGHSYILPVAMNVKTVYLPIQFYLFSDGAYIIDADDPYKKFIGCEVLSIHGIPVTKLVDDMNGYVHQDNKYTVRWFAPSILRFRGLYEWYGNAAGANNIDMELKERNGKKIPAKISFIPATNFHGIPKLMASRLENAPPVPLYLSRVEDNFWYKTIQEKKVFYFQFNQVEDQHDRTIASFSLKLDSALHAGKYNLFVIDVRHNNGGNLTLLPPLVEVIKRFERENPSSKIIVITGRNTFSAAQVFIAQLNYQTHALFAGEPSSSSPNFVGEGNYIRLPYSGAMGSISNKYHETIPGDHRKWIEPDYPISLSAAMYFQNRDPVMEYILQKDLPAPKNNSSHQ